MAELEGHPIHLVNALFYQAPPQDYFRRRLLFLLGMASRQPQLDQVLAGALSFGQVSLVWHPGDANSEERKTKEYVAIESEVLAHHLYEVLLRMYLAHTGHRPCPAMEIATLLDFAEFKRRVRARFASESPPTAEQLQDVGEVFLGIDHPSNSEPARTRYANGAANIEAYLRRFSSIYLNGAHLYNAAKHGFVVSPGEKGFAISADGSQLTLVLAGGSLPLDSTAIFEHTGLAVGYIERERRRQTEDWSLAIRWLDVERTVFYAARALEFLTMLWLVGQARRLNTRIAPPPYCDEPSFEDVERSFGEGTYEARIGLATRPAKKRPQERL